MRYLNNNSDNNAFSCYYAAHSGFSGFHSYFGDIFGKFDKLFIIKGAPGCGKSTLMKKAAAYFESNDVRIERIHCASDINSLDGLTIPSMSTAIVDGTSPHTLEPRYPGACDSIINLGDCWNKCLLEEKKSEIIELFDRKLERYKLAYNILSAAEGINRKLNALIHKAFKTEKASAFARRIFLNEILPQTDSRNEFDLIRPSIAFASSADGTAGRLDTFANARKKYLFNDEYGIASRLFWTLYVLAKENSVSTVVSPDILDRNELDSLYFPDADILFCRNDCDGGNVAVKHINTMRFLDSDTVNDNRQKEKFARKCVDSLVCMARDSLICAKTYHAKLEAIYREAMDFDKVNKKTEELIFSIAE